MTTTDHFRDLYFTRRANSVSLADICNSNMAFKLKSITKAYPFIWEWNEACDWAAQLVCHRVEHAVLEVCELRERTAPLIHCRVSFYVRIAEKLQCRLHWQLRRTTNVLSNRLYQDPLKGVSLRITGLTSQRTACMPMNWQSRTRRQNVWDKVGKRNWDSQGTTTEKWVSRGLQLTNLCMMTQSISSRLSYPKLLLYL